MSSEIAEPTCEEVRDSGHLLLRFWYACAQWILQAFSSSISEDSGLLRDKDVAPNWDGLEHAWKEHAATLLDAHKWLILLACSIVLLLLVFTIVHLVRCCHACHRKKLIVQEQHNAKDGRSWRHVLWIVVAATLFVLCITVLIFLFISAWEMRRNVSLYEPAAPTCAEKVDDHLRNVVKVFDSFVKSDLESMRTPYEEIQKTFVEVCDQRRYGLQVTEDRLASLHGVNNTEGLTLRGTYADLVGIGLISPRKYRQLLQGMANLSDEACMFAEGNVSCIELFDASLKFSRLLIDLVGALRAIPPLADITPVLESDVTVQTRLQIVRRLLETIDEQVAGLLLHNRADERTGWLLTVPQDFFGNYEHSAKRAARIAGERLSTVSFVAPSPTYVTERDKLVYNVVWYASLSVGSVLLVIVLVWVLAFVMLMCRKQSDAHGSAERKNARGMFFGSFATVSSALALAVAVIGVFFLFVGASHDSLMCSPLEQNQVKPSEITMRLHGVVSSESTTSSEWGQEERLHTADILRKCSVNSTYLHLLFGQTEPSEMPIYDYQFPRDLMSNVVRYLNDKANESISAWQSFEGKSNRQAFDAYRKRLDEVFSMFLDLPRPEALQASDGSQNELRMEYIFLYLENDLVREQWDYFVELMDSAYEKFDTQRELVEPFPKKLESIIRNITDCVSEYGQNVTVLFEEHTNSMLASAEESFICAPINQMASTVADGFCSLILLPFNGIWLAMLTWILVLVLLVICIARVGGTSRKLATEPNGSKKADKPTKSKEDGHKSKSGYVGWERPDVNTLRDEPMVEVHASPAATVDNSDPSEWRHTDIVATRPTKKEIVA
ncbi:hypothetical protein AAVH_07423 [Aphelenchoides avenae]|nr:hypothetical protein AAVH_07423 [Aphelenchus avenae]